MRTLLLALSLLLAAPAAGAGAGPSPLRPVHTYSIVARDPKTGELGVAVQSHWFGVGQVVPWAEAGVGAIATQSFVEPSYGFRGLELLRTGLAPQAALDALLAKDAGKDVRQVAFIDARGRVAAHTGAKCIQAAGHLVGENFSVQANMMEKPSVWPAMAKAFESAQGDLAERMLAALEAAEREGGDIRGKQAAALIVVAGKSTGKPWMDRRFDLRVDDHPEPLKELRRLLTLQRAYNHMNAGDVAMEKQDVPGALQAYSAAQKLAPDNAEMVFWTAVSLVNAKRVDEALPLFARTYKADPRWRELVKRLPRSGLLPDDAKLLQRLTSAK